MPRETGDRSMLSFLSLLVFGSALVLGITLIATALAPRWRYILALLAEGPSAAIVAQPALAALPAPDRVSTCTPVMKMRIRRKLPSRRSRRRIAARGMGYCATPVTSFPPTFPSTVSPATAR